MSSSRIIEPQSRSTTITTDTSSTNLFPEFPAIVDDDIDTEQFLQASRGVVRLLDKFGKLFAPVKHDMQGNIDKLNAKYQTDTKNHAHLRDMILLETVSGKNLVAVDALLWLRRGLYMIQLFFARIVEDYKAGKATPDLVAFLKKAYKEALEPYHGWMAQQLFGLLSRMVPNRSQLLEALVPDHSKKEDSMFRDMEVFLDSLRKNNDLLRKFYEEHDLESNAKV